MHQCSYKDCIASHSGWKGWDLMLNWMVLWVQTTPPKDTVAIEQMLASRLNSLVLKRRFQFQFRFFHFFIVISDTYKQQNKVHRVITTLLVKILTPWNILLRIRQQRVVYNNRTVRNDKIKPNCDKKVIQNRQDRRKQVYFQGPSRHAHERHLRQHTLAIVPSMYHRCRPCADIYNRKNGIVPSSI